MNWADFLMGVLAGAGAAAIVTTVWLERFQANHFDQLLSQIHALSDTTKTGN